jgi:hypothetical protein
MHCFGHTLGVLYHDQRWWYNFSRAYWSSGHLPRHLGFRKRSWWCFVKQLGFDRLRFPHQIVPEKENSCRHILPNVMLHSLMHSTKPLKEVTHRRSARSYIIFLTAAVTAFALYAFSSSPTAYTVCSSSSRIYTVNELQPQAQCITIKNDRIIRVGKHGKLRPYSSQKILC